LYFLCFIIIFLLGLEQNKIIKIKLNDWIQTEKLKQQEMQNEMRGRNSKQKQSGPDREAMAVWFNQTEKNVGGNHGSLI
jgi:hypothetical protein